MVRLRVARTTVGHIAAYIALSLAVALSLIPSIGPLATVEAFGSLLVVATAAGAALVRRLFNQPGIFHYLYLGTVFGLGFLSLGGLLSHLTGVYLIRWLPTVLGFAVWFLPRRTRRVVVAERPLTFPAWGVVGSTIAMVGLLPSLYSALLAQPSAWVGWRNIPADLSFDVAISSEVATRAPESYPWVHGTPLSYTWLYHSAMGVWASLTGVGPTDVVLQVWPVLFVILMPIIISIVGWELSRNRYVALVAPLAYVFAHGLNFAPGGFAVVPFQQVSPTRDFASLFVLVVILSLSRTLGRHSWRAFSPWWLVALGISTFVATGAKGSALPILLGGALCCALVLVLRRRVRPPDLLVLAVFLFAGVSSYFLDLPDPGFTERLSWNPLTFLDSNIRGRAVISLTIVLALAATIVAFWIVIGARARGGWRTSSLLAGVLAAGLLGLTLLDYAGASQNYFWESAQPVFAIAGAWVAVILSREFGWRFAAALLGVFLVTTVVAMIWSSRWPLILAMTVLALVASVALIVTHGGELRLATPRGLLAALVLAGVLIQGAQVVAISTGAAGGVASDATDSSAIDSTQLRAFRYIAEHSSPDDLLVTNKHCRAGSIAAGNCDPRWFALSAGTGRAVLAEGWAYTQHGSSPAWITPALKLGDDFIDSPTPQQELALRALGVRYVYVDKREPYSTELASVATRVYKSKWADVYLLKG